MEIFQRITILSLAVYIFSLFAVGCGNSNKYSEMESELHCFVATKNAAIGVAVIVDGKDTVMVNGDKLFPMMSVYKLPVAMAVADYCRQNGVGFDSTCLVAGTALHRDTYSPMMRVYGEVDSFRISIRKLLEYTLQQSDNNASDILLDMAGGATFVAKYLSDNGFEGISIRWSEDEMHKDTSRCWENSSTPLAMARLIDAFDTDNEVDTLQYDLRRMLETCATGTDRLAAPLIHDNTIIGHKTGTGDVDADGRIMALNDAGYVHLPNGHRYSIAVFVTSSPYDMTATAAIIAEISRIVVQNIDH